MYYGVLPSLYDHEMRYEAVCYIYLKM